MHVAIVGAGMAGLSAGTALVAAGHQVTIFDKGRGAGGRMATRGVQTPRGLAQFDYGAQYFTVRDPAFAACVSGWVEAGLAARWPAAGKDAWVGTPTMNAPAKAMAAALNVEWTTRVDAVEASGSGWVLRTDEPVGVSYDMVIIALPAEQAAVLLEPIDGVLARLAAATVSAPCWTVMATFGQPVAHRSDVLSASDGPIGWAARNSAKPGRLGPEAWVIQGTPEWSIAHLEDNADDVERALLTSFTHCVGTVPEAEFSVAHRWRYARSGVAGGGFRWNAASRLGLCGDWFLGARVEAAWLSGNTLAAAMCR